MTKSYRSTIFIPQILRCILRWHRPSLHYRRNKQELRRTGGLDPLVCAAVMICGQPATGDDGVHMIPDMQECPAASGIPFHQPRILPNQLRQRFGLKLREQVGAVRLNGARRHIQRAADFLVCQA